MSFYDTEPEEWLNDMYKNSYKAPEPWGMLIRVLVRIIREERGIE